MTRYMTSCTPKTKNEMWHIAASIAVAALLWFVMFSPWTAPLVNFWTCMTVAALLLAALALMFGGRRCLGFPDETSPALTLLIGVAIAMLLWVVFYVGDKLSQCVFASARTHVNLIYNMKEGFSPTLLSLLLMFIIGPAEEIFWRGYIQRTLSVTFSPLAAYIMATSVYTVVHLPSGNYMLVLAALVCGAAWGGLYLLMPHRLKAIIISHAIWDAAAFVWLPF